jgi:hypothetical protein
MGLAGLLPVASLAVPVDVVAALTIVVAPGTLFRATNNGGRR